MTNNVFLAAYASVIGSGHIAQNMPLQDACNYELWENGWGCAIVCDGAGSCVYSHIGAVLCVDFFLRKLKGIHWDILLNYPQQLQKEIHTLFYQCVHYLQYSRYPLEELACTVNTVVFSDNVLISFHIGDGRAGYSDTNGNWRALFTPQKGEEANQTLFITSPIWQNNPTDWIDIQIIQENYTAFCVLSDGCEKAAFECNIWSEEEQRFKDPNLPYSKFFNPLVQGIQQLYAHNKTYSEIQQIWKQFLKEGNKTLAQETDDKSLILVCKNSL
jgi:hypothetical protein